MRSFEGDSEVEHLRSLQRTWYDHRCEHTPAFIQLQQEHDRIAKDRDQLRGALEALREASKAHRELAEYFADECDRLREALAAIGRLCSGEDQPPDNEQADCTEDVLREIEKIAKQALAAKEPSLDALIESARTHVMTPGEHRAQVISFAYGNLAIENPAITREMVERAYDELAGKEAG